MLYTIVYKVGFLMLPYKKKKLLEKFQGYYLKADKFLFQSAGYLPHETLVKIHTHKLFCSVAGLSLDKCLILLTLSPKEYDSFKKYENRPASIKFSYSDVFFKEPLSFYIRGHLGTFIKQKEEVYTIEMKYESITESYKDIFLFLTTLNSKYQLIYDSDSKVNKEKCITPKTFHIGAIYKKGILQCDGFIEDISPKFVTLKISKCKNVVKEDEVVELTTVFYNRHIKLPGKIANYTDGICQLNLNYKTDFIYILTKFID